MNSREAWAWSTVVHCLTEPPPLSAQEWADLEEAIDYLGDRAYKAFKRSGDDKFAQAVVMLPVWATKRIEDLLRRASAVPA